jgi:hypothetical protein
MIWLMERGSDLLTCEIRCSPDPEVYEFEVAPSNGPAETRTFTSATELINHHLLEQSTLQQQGWRPRPAA